MPDDLAVDDGKTQVSTDPLPPPETIEGGKPEEAQVETTPPGAPEELLDRRIRETEERLVQTFESRLAEMSRADRQSAKAKLEEVKSYFDQVYLAQASTINQLVKEGMLDPQAAVAKKQALREGYDIQALEQARTLALASSARAMPQAPEQTLQATSLHEWENRKRDILEALDLTGQEPEFREAISQWQNVNDLERAAAQFKRLAKDARKAVDVRVKGTTVERQKKAAPILEGGGGGAAVPMTNPQEEAESLLAKMSSGDLSHVDMRKAERRLKELARAMGG